MVGHRAQRSPRQGPPLATRIRSTARPTCWRLTPRSRLRMALEFSIPGRYSILTTAMTTSMPSPGQARSGFGCGTRESWHDKVGFLGLFIAACAPPRNIVLTICGRHRINDVSACSLPVARELCQCHFRADKLSQAHHGPSSWSGAILLSVRTPYPLLCPFGRDEGSKEGLPAPLRMGGAETNRRSPLPHATPVLLSPSQGCIPAWDDEEVAHVVCPPKWEYRDHPTPEAMRRRASI